MAAVLKVLDLIGHDDGGKYRIDDRIAVADVHRCGQAIGGADLEAREQPALAAGVVGLKRGVADPNAVWVSARVGTGRDELLARVAAELAMDAERARFTLDEGRDDDRRLIADLYRHARVVSHTTAEGLVSIEADVPRRWLNRFMRVRVPA